MTRKAHLCVIGMFVAVLAVTRSGADVPNPSPPGWDRQPAPDYGAVEVQATYDSPTLIRYATHVYDKDRNQLNNNMEDVDRAWFTPMPYQATNPPHYANQRTILFERSDYQNQTGHLLWRVTGGMFPTQNDVDVNIQDKWQQLQNRMGGDNANDTKDGSLLFGASFVVKAQTGKLKVVVVGPPNNNPVNGATVLIDGAPSGTTDASGTYIRGGMTPGPYSVKATMGMLSSQLTPATVVKGQTVLVNLTLVPPQM